MPKQSPKMQRIPWHHTTQKLAIGRNTAGTLALSLIRWVLQTQLVSSALPILNSSEVGDRQHSEKKHHHLVTCIAMPRVLDNVC